MMLEILQNRWAKRQYQGRLIHLVEDQWGRIEVIDRQGERSLHFGRPEKQSAMDLTSPHRLLLDYTQAMILALMLRPEIPSKVLFLGLGGGSMVKYLLRLFPQMLIEAVELRPKVVEVAEEFFYLPKNKNLKVIVGDAQEYLVQAQGASYDLIFVDAFESGGISGSVQGPLFVTALKGALSKNGLAALNLWTMPEGPFNLSFKLLDEAFYSQVLFAKIPDRTNCILFPLNSGLKPPSTGQLTRRAKEWEPSFNINLPRWAARMAEDNLI